MIVRAGVWVACLPDSNRLAGAERVGSSEALRVRACAGLAQLSQAVHGSKCCAVARHLPEVQCLDARIFASLCLRVAHEV